MTYCDNCLKCIMISDIKMRKNFTNHKNSTYAVQMNRCMSYDSKRYVSQWRTSAHLVAALYGDRIVMSSILTVMSGIVCIF